MSPVFMDYVSIHLSIATSIFYGESFINSFEGMDKTQCLYYKYITIVYSVFKNLIKVTNEP